MGAVPADTYNGEFVSIEPYVDNLDRYGEGIRLIFKVIGGDHDGDRVSRICSKTFSVKSNLYRFAKSLAGRDLRPGEQFDFQDFIGTRGMMVVEETDSGAIRVASFLRSAD